MMETGNTHQMQMQQQYSDGSQEWLCPTCGRQFILHFPPHYNLEVLVEGNVEASHTGGTGGLQMGSASISMSQPHNDVEAHLVQPEKDSPGSPDDPGVRDGHGDKDDPYLEPWARWLNGKI